MQIRNFIDEIKEDFDQKFVSSGEYYNELYCYICNIFTHYYCTQF